MPRSRNTNQSTPKLKQQLELFSSKRRIQPTRQSGHDLLNSKNFHNQNHEESAKQSTIKGKAYKFSATTQTALLYLMLKSEK